MSKRKINHYLLILDKSGSMQSVKNEAIAGFNEQVQTIKDLTRKYPKQEFKVSLVTFNHEVDTVFMNQQAEELEELKKSHYNPDGMTALYDAIGLSTSSLKNEIEDELKKEDVKIIVSIFTDGYENSSKEYKISDIAESIEALKKTKKWIFTYIGTNQDVVAVAKKMNVATGNVGIYNVGKIGTQSAFRSASQSISNYAQARSVMDKTALDNAGENMMESWDKDYAKEEKALEEDEK